MFTGIVDNIGIVASFKESFLEVSVTGFLHDIKKGDSVAINGVCLTVVDIKKDQFSVEVVPETKRRTNLTKLMKGDFINLEKSVQAGGRLGGHFVQGHVDDIGIIKHIVKDGEADIVKIEVDESIGQYIVLKGYVAVDGVSFKIEKGKSLGVVGESGCGKTITALSLLLLHPQPEGQIEKGNIFFSIIIHSQIVFIF